MRDQFVGRGACSHILAITNPPSRTRMGWLAAWRELLRFSDLPCPQMRGTWGTHFRAGFRLLRPVPPATYPAFQLLFACNGISDVNKSFKPDKPIAWVGGRESGVLFSLVLKDTLVQISGNADVQGATTARNDVCVVEPFMRS